MQSSSSPTVRRQPSQINAPEEDVVDPREIDKVLSELAGMVGRWSLFKKFITEQLRVSAPPHSPKMIPNVVLLEDDYVVGIHKNCDGENTETPYAQTKILLSHALDETQLSGESRAATTESARIFESTASHRLFEDLLATYYTPLEIWYTRTIIDKVANFSLWLLFNILP